MLIPILISVFTLSSNYVEIDTTIRTAGEENRLLPLYQAYVKKAQADTADPLSRYGAVMAYCWMKDISAVGLRSYEIDKELPRARRMASDCVRLAPTKAHPLVARMRIETSIEVLGPRPLGSGRAEWQWFTEINTRTGERKRIRKKVYVYDDVDPRILEKQLTMVDHALALEPENPVVLIIAAQTKPLAAQKLAYVKRAAEAGAKAKYSLAYLFAAQQAYRANGLDHDEQVASRALRAELKANPGSIWTKLFVKQHPEFAQ